MDAVLCDSDGMVSTRRHPKFDGSFLHFLNHLRRLSGHAPYEGAPFPCTGSAHLAHEHIRCTSSAHRGAAA